MQHGRHHRGAIERLGEALVVGGAVGDGAQQTQSGGCLVQSVQHKSDILYINVEMCVIKSSEGCGIELHN